MILLLLSYLYIYLNRYTLEKRNIIYEMEFNLPTYKYNNILYIITNVTIRFDLDGTVTLSPTQKHPALKNSNLHCILSNKSRYVFNYRNKHRYMYNVWLNIYTAYVSSWIKIIQ